MSQSWRACSARSAQSHARLPRPTTSADAAARAAPQGSYVDDIAVRCAFHAQKAASALLAGAATALGVRGGMSLDVRAANRPALYKSLGFRIEALEHPGFPWGFLDRERLIRQ